MQQWEYNIVEKELNPCQLNELGKEGWELVGFYQMAESSVDGTHVFVFKRPVEAEQNEPEGHQVGESRIIDRITQPRKPDAKAGVYPSVMQPL